MSGTDPGPRGPRRWDLAAVAALSALAGVATLLPAVRASPVRALLGVALATVLPGYALLAAAVPRRLGRARAESDPSHPHSTDADPADPHGSGDGGNASAALRPPGRFALAVGLSVAATAVFALAASAAGALSAATVTWGLVATALAGCAVAARRRGAREDGRRGDTPGRSPGALAADAVAAARSWPDGRSTAGTALDVAVAATALLALGVVVGLLAGPVGGGNGAAELALLSGEGPGRDAGGYPADLAPGENASVVVAVENGARGTRQYSVVVTLQRVTLVAGNDSAGGRREGPVTVRSERRVGTYRRSLAAGERFAVDQSFAAREPGRYRLVARLYRGDPGGEPHHRVHLWVTVSPRNGTAANDSPRNGTAATTPPATVTTGGGSTPDAGASAGTGPGVGAEVGVGAGARGDPR